MGKGGKRDGNDGTDGTEDFLLVFVTGFEPVGDLGEKKAGKRTMREMYLIGSWRSTMKRSILAGTLGAAKMSSFWTISASW